MRELKVGERVTITLEVVERKGGCKGCFFSTSGECFKRADFDFACLKCERSDKKCIIFIFHTLYFISLNITFFFFFLSFGSHWNPSHQPL